MNTRVLPLLPALWLAGPATAAPRAASPGPGDAALADYFRDETAHLTERCLADVRSLEDWAARRARLREQLQEMLGLAPWPARTDLKAVVTGRIEHESFRVENLHFQTLPGLYVTANLYLPREQTRPAPTILYVCGHGPVITNKISYGNKVTYQHHGAWFARHGYVCLIMDTVQWGEILGVHHGTYREGLWWWNARGYTPAGVEAWNSLRALDYLSTRPEVDTNRFGITGRSGGGAYSWFAAALDDRLKVIAPVAGITDLRNHVVDGTVEGHCDCMFFVNTYRWDYPLLAALCAPRPLLLVNTDSDTIFPLDGVLRTHAKVKRLYELHRATNLFGLVIGPGPHKDTQDLQVPVFRWFNKHLKGEEPLIEAAATKFFTPAQLKALDALPSDAINSNIHASFVPAAAPAPVPTTSEAWRLQVEGWRAALQAKCFAGWPEAGSALVLERRVSVERSGLRFQIFKFESQPHVRLRLYTLQRSGLRRPERLVLNVVAQPPTPAGAAAASLEGPANCPDFGELLGTLTPVFAEELRAEMGATSETHPPNAQAFAALKQRLQTNPTVLAWLAPRGVGLTAWGGDTRKQTHVRRRFMLLGQTLDGMRVWDIRRAVQAVRAVREWRALPLWLQAEGAMAGDALYAALFEPQVAGLDLWRLPPSHQIGPDFLNVLRVLDVPHAVAMATDRATVRLWETEAHHWTYPQAVVRALQRDPGCLVIAPTGASAP